MIDEYEYGPWIEVPAMGRLEFTRDGRASYYVSFPDCPIVYRIATPKPKRELVVGKWYRDNEGVWRQCIYFEGNFGWLRRAPRHDAHSWPLDGIDWSTPPRDEAPNE